MEKAIELLLQQVKIESELDLSKDVERYVKMTMLLQELTDVQNELLKKMNEEEITELIAYFRSNKTINRVKMQSLDTLSAEEKQTFFEMLDGIATQVFTQDDRLGWLLTRVLTEYYIKISGFDIQKWMYDVPGEQQLKLTLLLMSQRVNFGENNQFPDIKFFINRYKQNKEE